MKRNSRILATMMTMLLCMFSLALAGPSTMVAQGDEDVSYIAPSADIVLRGLDNTSFLIEQPSFNDVYGTGIRSNEDLNYDLVDYFGNDLFAQGYTVVGSTDLSGDSVSVLKYPFVNLTVRETSIEYNTVQDLIPVDDLVTHFNLVPVPLE